MNSPTVTRINEWIDDVVEALEAAIEDASEEEDEGVCVLCLAKAIIEDSKSAFLMDALERCQEDPTEAKEYLRAHRNMLTAQALLLNQMVEAAEEMFPED